MEYTANCSVCGSIKKVKQIHIDIPIVLVLECNHIIEITDLKFGISQIIT